MTNEFEDKLRIAKECSKQRNEFIQSYFSFIVKCVSNHTGSYIAVGDSDELSVGLIAFNEAIEKYEFERGTFLAFAKLVIESRLNTYFTSGKECFQKEPIEVLDTLSDDHGFDSEDLSYEIEIWKREMNKFNITFQKLIATSPKHKDTRDRAINISEVSSANQEIVKIMYSKLRLPIELIHKQLGISTKIVDRSKFFITSVILIFTKELEALRKWIRR